jgi:hypothetical protein
MCDVVFTLPKDWPKERDPYEFFQLCHEFLRKRYGDECSLPGFVHMDETTPHMHCPIVPVVDGEIRKRDVVTRADLKSFHGNLQSYLDKELGFHVSVLLDESQAAEKAKSKLTQDELDALNKEIKADVDKQVASERAEIRSEASELKQGEEALKREKEAFKRASDKRWCEQNERDREQDDRDDRQDERDREQDSRQEGLDRQRAAIDKQQGELDRQWKELDRQKQEWDMRERGVKSVLATVNKLIGYLEKRIQELRGLVDWIKTANDEQERAARVREVVPKAETMRKEAKKAEQYVAKTVVHVDMSGFDDGSHEDEDTLAL